MMGQINELLQKGEMFLDGLKHIAAQPYKLNGLISDEIPLLKKYSSQLISCVKNPYAWFYQFSVVKVSAEECQVKLDGPRLWTQSADQKGLQSPLLFLAEECMRLYWQNAFIFNFSMKLTQIEMNISSPKNYPVECVFSMDINDRNQWEWELKTQGQAHLGVNLNFYSHGNEVGQIYVVLEMNLPRVLSSRD